MKLILASTSPYRRELLKRLGLPFRTLAPKFDEEKFKDQGLKPIALAQLLAKKKAESLRAPDRCVIGGDQVVSFRGNILGKPGDAKRAFAQLSQMQGQTHELITAVHVVCGSRSWKILDRTKLKMRRLSPLQIKKYVTRDRPFDCAGSYKIELGGIALFEKVDSADFTAIQGLPLIRLTTVLKKIGMFDG